MHHRRGAYDDTYDTADAPNSRADIDRCARSHDARISAACRRNDDHNVNDNDDNSSNDNFVAEHHLFDDYDIIDDYCCVDLGCRLVINQQHLDVVAVERRNFDNGGFLAGVRDHVATVSSGVSHRRVWLGCRR